MKFIVSTKPLVDSLGMAIVNANVTKSYGRSCVVQITATPSELKINAEAASICSEICLKGRGDPDMNASTFVDSLTFKQLVSTFDSPTVTFEFTEGGLILHSGKSKFTLPRDGMLDEADVSLKVPTPLTAASDAVEVAVDKSDWKFIKDHQMYAMAMSFAYPIYHNVWLGADHDVLVSDYAGGLFTHSTKNKLGRTCLVSDTIVNFFNSLPEGSTFIPNGDSYLIFCKTDGFEMVTELTPTYESDEGVGSYNSEIFLATMEHPTSAIKVNLAAINKFLSQAELLSTNKAEDTIKFIVEGNQLSMQDRNVDCKVAVDGSAGLDYVLEFKVKDLKSVFANYCSDTVFIGCTQQADVVTGIIVWDDELTTMLAGVANGV